jgi:hypothetical protein
LADGSGYTLTVDWGNYEALCGEVEGLPDRVVKGVAKELKERLRKEAPHGVTGRLAASFEVTKGTGQYVVESKETGYAVAVDKGTKARPPPKKGPPPDAIKEWANFRGLPWFLVWRSIVRHGTKANKYVDRAMEGVEDEIPLIFSTEFNRLTGKAGKIAGYMDDYGMVDI